MNSESPICWEMTAPTLWAVWTQSRPIFVKAGVVGPVSQGWALASAGEPGLAEIRQSVSRGFVAALSLSDLQKAWNVMTSVEQGLFGRAMDRWLPFALSVYVVLIEDQKGQFVWTPIRASSDAQALTLGSDLGRVMASGKAEDLKRTIEEGVKILAAKDYERVLVDVRPIALDHPPGWLTGKRGVPFGC